MFYSTLLEGYQEGLVMLAPAALDEAAIAQPAAIKELTGELPSKHGIF